MMQALQWKQKLEPVRLLPNLFFRHQINKLTNCFYGVVEDCFKKRLLLLNPYF